MRRRRKRDKKAEAEVMLSPLIDCVFLLLIFFLVTSMLKKWERQIPVTLADPTAAVSVQSTPDAVYVGIDRAGNVYEEAGRNTYGVVQFAPVQTELGTFLSRLAQQRGRDEAIELVVEPGTGFQVTIDVLGVFEVQGFDNVQLRVRDRGFARPRRGGS